MKPHPRGALVRRYVEFGYVDHTGQTVLHIVAQSGSEGDQDRREFEEELQELLDEDGLAGHPQGYVWHKHWPEGL